MKTLFFVLLMSVVPAISWGMDCSIYPSKVDNHYVYAEILTPSHMTMTFVVLSRVPMTNQVKVVEGTGNEPGSCDADPADLIHVNSSVAVQESSSQSSLTKVYRICVYGRQGQLVDSMVVCNSTTGD